MKKPVINYSFPATLSFSADNTNENERFTRGKLKVFYKGETADHRYFSNEFSEELVKSLPYTPIVSYYDEEKEDFVGHATQQAIYGIVDPCSKHTFEKDDNNITWCVCETVYYTERPDKVGEIAKKIEGHSQSLELDPHTVKYTVNYDERRHFKNIEFTAGKFVGVSVLGKDQKPAFTGSEFFDYNEDFENKMKILRDYCEHKNDQVENGGTIMNLQEFMKLSWGDVSAKVDEAISQEYGNEAYTIIVDMFEDSAIVRWYSYIDGTNKLMRVKYSCDENGLVTLGDVNEVRITYEDVVTPSTTATVETSVDTNSQATTDNTDTTSESSLTDTTDNSNAEEQSVVDSVTDAGCGNSGPDDDEEDKTKHTDTTVDAEPTVDAANNSDAANAAQVSNAEVTDTTEKVSVDNENSTEEENSSSTSFTESERAEFESLKREKKINLINSYKDTISEDDFNNFMNVVDEKSEEELEVELLKSYKRNTAEVLKEKPQRAFSFNPILNINEKKESSLDSWVRRNL